MSETNVVRNVFTAIQGLSPDDQVRAFAWMSAALNGGDFERTMLESISLGHFRIRFRADGTPEFTLTEQGREVALRAMASHTDVPQ